MGEIIWSIVKSGLFIGIFYMIIAVVRRRLFNDEYDPLWHKGDGLILLLLAYMWVFVVDGLGFLSGYLEMTYLLSPSIPSDTVIKPIQWVPYLGIIEHNEYVVFMQTIRENSDFYKEIQGIGLVFYYMKLLLGISPVIYVSYVVSERKLPGCVIGLLTTLFCANLMSYIAVGDMVLMYLVGYGLFAIGAKVSGQWIHKPNTVRQYVGFSLVFALVMVFLGYINVNYRSDGRFVGSLEMDQSYETYNNNVTVNIDEVDLYKTSMNTYEVRFFGDVEIHDGLLAGTPFEGVEMSLSNKNLFHVTHEYSYEGMEQGIGIGLASFKRDSKTWHREGLELPNYDTFGYDDNDKKSKRLRERADADDLAYFEYYGISQVRLDLSDHLDEFSGYEVLEEGFGHDEYLYYEVIYQVNSYGLSDEELRWALIIHPTDSLDGMIPYEYTDPEVLNETEGVQTVRQRIYFYQVLEEEIDHVDVRLYHGYLNLDTVQETYLFGLEIEQFK